MSETDRQLKDRLNTNQAMRERMCLDLLQTQPHFTEVRPRLPKGGPDGGRDIEALYKDKQRVFGAVGFVNDATDTEEHRRKARTKFGEDLARLSGTTIGEQDSTPDVFVFFTNVGLTPGIIDDLKKSAYAANISICEIYDRERMRIMLDCNTGYAIRQRYLDIPLSDAEQKDFFGKWGDDLQTMMSTGLSGIETLARRLHFLAEAQFLVDEISVIVKLTSPVGEISGGNFLFQTMITLRTNADGLLSMSFGSSSEPIVETIDQFRERGSQFSNNTQRGFSYADLSPGSPQYERYQAIPGEEVDDDVERWVSVGSSRGVLQIEKPYIRARYGSEPFLERLWPTCRLIDLHRCMVLFDCNAAIAEHVEEVFVLANQYCVLHLRKHDFRIGNGSFDRFRLPAELSHIEPSGAWCILRPADASSFMPDFYGRTPERWLAVDA